MANEVKSAGSGAASGSVAPSPGIPMDARIDIVATALIEANQLLSHLLQSEPSSIDPCVTRALIARAHRLTGACFAAIDEETEQGLSTLRQALQHATHTVGTGARYD